MCSRHGPQWSASACFSCRFIGRFISQIRMVLMLLVCVFIYFFLDMIVFISAFSIVWLLPGSEIVD